MKCKFLRYICQWILTGFVRICTIQVIPQWRCKNFHSPAISLKAIWNQFPYSHFPTRVKHCFYIYHRRWVLIVLALHINRRIWLLYLPFARRNISKVHRAVYISSWFRFIVDWHTAICSPILPLMDIWVLPSLGLPCFWKHYCANILLDTHFLDGIPRQAWDYKEANEIPLGHKFKGLLYLGVCLCGVSGSWCAWGLFEPSQCLWQEWSLSLNANSPLLPICWGFSFALGPGFLLTALPAPTILLRFLWPWMWGISSHPFQLKAAAAPDLARGVSSHCHSFQHHAAAVAT